MTLAHLTAALAERYRLEQQYRYGFAMHGGRFYIPIVDRKADVWVAEVEGR
jgi:hypothetical protein